MDREPSHAIAGLAGRAAVVTSGDQHLVDAVQREPGSACQRAIALQHDEQVGLDGPDGRRPVAETVLECLFLVHPFRRHEVDRPRTLPHRRAGALIVCHAMNGYTD